MQVRILYYLYFDLYLKPSQVQSTIQFCDTFIQHNLYSFSVLCINNIDAQL